MSEVGLAERQNNPVALRRLAAMRVSYTRAKRLHLARIAVTVGLAGVAPFVRWWWPAATAGLAAAAGLWVFVARLLFQRWEQSLIRRAALTQEDFDVRVLGLPWNPLLGDPPSAETVSSLADRHGEPGDLRDWYPDVDSDDDRVVALMCQRSSVAWSQRQHRLYGAVVATVTVAWFAVGVVIALVDGASLGDYLVSLALPSMPALLSGGETAEAHFDAARLRRRIGAHVARALKGDADVAPREVQDAIFELRTTAPLVPDWLYRLVSDRFERDMRRAVSEMGG